MFLQNRFNTPILSLRKDKDILFWAHGGELTATNRIQITLTWFRLVQKDPNKLQGPDQASKIIQSIKFHQIARLEVRHGRS